MLYNPITVLNINIGKNQDLLNKCSRLKEYSMLVFYIRENIEKRISVENSVRIAVDRCIREGILVDFLAKNKAEVMDVILTEYNEQNHILNEKQISFEQGVEEEKKNTELERKRAEAAEEGKRKAEEKIRQLQEQLEKLQGKK